MALVASQTSNLTPEGQYPAVCCGAVDLGHQKTQFEGKGITYPVKFALLFEIPELVDEDGNPEVVSKLYTNSLNEKASFYKDLKGWLARGLSEEELRTYNIKKLLGLPAFITIIHEKKGAKIRSNVSAIAPVPRGLPAPKGLLREVFYEIEQGMQSDDFKRVPEWLQKMIVAAEEFKPGSKYNLSAAKPAATQAAPASAPAAEEKKDNIPF